MVICGKREAWKTYVVAGEIQHGVEKRAGVAIGQDKTVTIVLDLSAIQSQKYPFGVLGIVVHHGPPQGVRNGRATHRSA